MTFPQLRVRTEFSFRSGGARGGVVAFGPVPRVVAHLKNIQCPSAGIVDSGTWGHVKWLKECKAEGIEPLFGVELPVPQEDGRRPVAWALAADVRALNRFSTATRVEGADIGALFKSATGIIRFAGTALTDPESFDYIDVNPGSQMATQRALRLAAATGKSLVITSDNNYPAAADRAPFLVIGGRENVTPQHILTLDELRAALPLSSAEFSRAVTATEEAAARCAHTLPAAPLIKVQGDLRAEVSRGKEYRLSRGHIPEWTAVHEERVQHELKLIEEKQFESYFLVVADLILWAKQRMLVGPGRGSSAGSLVCYLLRITEVDPLVNHLLFERFIDLTRADLPDIDIDFNDQKRELVFDYLAEKYGKDHVARIGNINSLKPKSVLNECGKRLGIPMQETFDVANVLVELSSGDARYGKGLEDTMSGTAPGRKFIAAHPEARVMFEVENHAWHTGVHAAGVLVCNEPISEFATVGADGVAQIEKKGAEALNLLKIDALGLRTLGVIEDSGVITSEELYSLTLDDPEVFKIFNEKRFGAVFQFEGGAQRSVSAQITVDSFTKIDQITALARPGPLGGGAANHYIGRAAGREEVTYPHPSTEPYLKATYGVVLYQEQVMRIVREIGNFSWAQTTIVRKAMSGRKGKEFFDQQGAVFVHGAVSNGMVAADAQTLWDQLCNYGAWSMNQSHTASYATVSYWCAHMKRYHPLEYAAACLRSAKDEVQSIEVLREMAAEGIAYTPFDIDLSQETWSVQSGRLVGGFSNVVGIGPVKARTFVEKRAAGKLTDKEREKILASKVRFDDLRPAHTLWGHIYDNPELANVNQPLDEFATMKEHEFGTRETGVVIGLVKRRDRRDRNEPTLIKRRGGERFEGQPLFVDVHVVDDSISKPVAARVNEKLWESIGWKLADRLVDDQDWLLMRGRWLKQFNVFLVRKVRCLNRPEILE